MNGDQVPPYYHLECCIENKKFADENSRLQAEVARLKNENGMQKAINILGSEGHEKAAIYLCKRMDQK